MTTQPEYVAIIGNDRIPTSAIVRERWEKFVRPYVANQATFVEVTQGDREANSVGLDNV